MIETTDLEKWADQVGAQNRFPLLIKRLIHLTITPNKIQFPSGNAIWIPGFDGVVVNSEKNSFVPMDCSVWEVSVRADFKRKADEDYAYRTENELKNVPPGIQWNKITYVCATPYIWADKTEWENSRIAEGKWKNVIVIDGTSLCDWLEVSEPIALQFAVEELGFPPYSEVQFASQAWNEWSTRSTCPTNEDLIVAGRELQEKEVIGRLIAPTNTLTVQADSPREACAFVLACIRRLSSGEDREGLITRTLVVQDEKAARAVLHRKNLILIIEQPKGQVSASLASTGCHVVVCVGNELPNNPDVRLSRPTHHEFAAVLVRSGIDEKKADLLARECGRSITILQCLHPHANAEFPKWVNRDSILRLMPAMLAGRWSENSQYDRQILCELFDAKEYSEVERQLQDFLIIDEPPLLKIGDMWTLTAPAHCFYLLASSVTRSDLDRFSAAFTRVFGWIDPKVEIAPEEWLYQDLKGEDHTSGWLRSGMAELALLFADRGESAKLRCIASPSEYIDQLISSLPGLRSDWRVLASLRVECARLMEAAPNPFLKALEEMIRSHQEDMQKLFLASDQDFISGGWLHIGLLWGLETLAWFPEHMPRVALILTQLCLLDKGVRVANRPIRSLTQIFLWWHSYTNASFKERLEILDEILSRHPDVGWSLLIGVLPKTPTVVAGPEVKPRWRDPGDQPSEAVDRSARIGYLGQIIDRALDRLRGHPERWHSLLESADILNQSQWEKFITLLKNLAENSELPIETRSALWNVFREFIYRHRTFQDAKWAMPSRLIDELAAFLDAFAPSENPIERYRWLFDDWFPDLPTQETDIQSREREVEAKRSGAVQEIQQILSWPGLVKLGLTSKYSGFVVRACQSFLSDLDNARQFFNEAVKHEGPGWTLGSQISGAAHELHGKEWREWIHQKAKEEGWDENNLANVMIFWPDDPGIWKEIAELGPDVDTAYWRKKPVPIIWEGMSDLEHQIDRFLVAGRAIELFTHVAFHPEYVKSNDLIRLFDSMFKELGKMTSSEEFQRTGLRSDAVKDVLDKLRSRGDIARSDVTRIEYAALPLLGFFNSSDLTIHEFMREDPKFFIDVICDLFLPAHRDRSNDVAATPEQEARGKAAFKLLHGMKMLPGQSGVEIEEPVLIQWTDTVRKIAEESDRAAAADSQLGSLFAHAPNDPQDGVWPHVAIRNLIEHLKSERIEQSIIGERVSMRGVSSRALYEGGKQERELAKGYREMSAKITTRWPRTAALLKNIAETWERFGQHEDDRAEQDKLE